MHAHLNLPAALVGLIASVAAAPWPARAAPDDFVVQQVCVDASDRAVAGDPAHCPQARTLRIGEAIPYRRVDAGNWQALYSYPVRGLGGERRAVAAKIFGGNDTTGSYGDLGIRSGYDLLEIGPTYVSGIRTSDPGGGDQIFWRTTDCVRTDGWIFFPPGLASGQRGSTRSTLKITPGPSTACPSLRNIAPDFTTWDRPVEPILYTSGKRLDTIVSQHFAYGDPSDTAHSDDSMERFYFTRPYGFSRWEAWQTPEGCRARVNKAGGDPAQQCVPSPASACNGRAEATFYGKTYLRLDCRDSTFLVAGAEPAFNPLVNAAAPGDIASRNLLVNGTFADGAAGWTVTGGAAEPMREPRSNNSVLAVMAPAGSMTVLAQDAAVPPAGGPGSLLRWGVSLAPRDGPASATLRLDITADGQTRTIDKPLAASGGRRDFAFDIPWPAGQPGAASARIALRFEGPASATVDDAYLAVVPGPP